MKTWRRSGKKKRVSWESSPDDSWRLRRCEDELVADENPSLEVIARSTKRPADKRSNKLSTPLRMSGCKRARLEGCRRFPVTTCTRPRWLSTTSTRVRFAPSLFTVCRKQHLCFNFLYWLSSCRCELCKVTLCVALESCCSRHCRISNAFIFGTFAIKRSKKTEKYSSQFLLFRCELWQLKAWVVRTDIRYSLNLLCNNFGIPRRPRIELMKALS